MSTPAANLQPRRSVGEVRDRIHTLLHVVEVTVGVAVACGAAHVGHEHRVAVLDEVLGEEVEVRARLPLRAAVDDQHRRRRLGSWSRPVEPRGDLSVVESGVVDEFRGNEGVPRKAAVRRARHGPQFVLSEVPHVDVARLGRAVKGEGEASRVGRERELSVHHRGDAEGV
jgi:hypothetical protein